MKNEIRFTLDNLTYNLVVNSSEDLSFVLPRRVPSAAIKESNKNVIKPAEQTTIKVFVKVQASPVPIVNIISEDEEVKITTAGSFELLPDTTSTLTFTTTDGGNSWLISSSIAAAATAEEAEQIAKNAQEIAVTAKQTATEAQEVATTAKTSADNATTVANTATSTAQTASATARFAQETAVSATSLAEKASTSAEAAQTAADNAQTTAEEAQETATEASKVAEDAQTTAGEALGEANIAKSTADIAKTLAEGAFKSESTTAQVIKSDVVLGNGKKFFVQTSNGDTPLAFAANKYSTGLEQFEVGTPKLPLCLNHCGTTVGESIDKHIKVDCKESASGETIKEQLAYLSDVSAAIDSVKASTLQLTAEGTQTINSHVAVAKDKKFLLTTKDGVNQINGIAVSNYNTGLEQVEVGSTTVPLCLNHCGTTEGETIDKHIRVDCKENLTSSVIKEQLAYLSDLPDVTKFVTTAESENTQTVNSNFAVGIGKRGLVTKQDGSTINSVSVIHYADTGLEQFEVGSATVPMCLNHSGTTDGSIDKHIGVDCRETPESSVTKEYVAYLSDVAKTMQLTSNTPQVLASDFVLGNTKKFFVQTANGDTPLAIAANKYDTGLEQFEVGTSKLPMCLNHCATDIGEVIDKHIKVEYKETADGPVVKDKMAYMSDLEALVARIEALEAKVQ